MSRVGSAAQIKAYKKVAGKVKLELAQFRELAAFSQFESDLDASTKARLDRGARIVEMFKQTAYNPIPVEIQTALMWAMQNNFFDSIEVSDINSAVTSLQGTHGRSRKRSVRSHLRIRETGGGDRAKAQNGGRGLEKDFLLNNSFFDSLRLIS